MGILFLLAAWGVKGPLDDNICLKLAQYSAGIGGCLHTSLADQFDRKQNSQGKTSIYQKYCVKSLEAVIFKKDLKFLRLMCATFRPFGISKHQEYGSVIFPDKTKFMKSQDTTFQLNTYAKTSVCDKGNIPYPSGQYRGRVSTRWT